MASPTEMVVKKQAGVSTMSSTLANGGVVVPSSNNSVLGSQSTNTAPATIINAAGGLRILNMNAVNVGGANTGNLQAGGMSGTTQKTLAPRMILNPRPCQPGVEDYQSEFSEFLMLNYKQNVNEDSEKEMHEESDCVTDQQDFQKVQNEDELSKCNSSILQPDIESSEMMEECKQATSELNPCTISLSKSSPCPTTESNLPSIYRPSEPSLLPSLTQSIVDQVVVLSPQKSDCSSDLIFLPASPPSIQYDDCVQAQTEQSDLPESMITCSVDNNTGSATTGEINNTNYNSSSSSSHAATFYRGGDEEENNQDDPSVIYSNNNNNSIQQGQEKTCQILPEHSKLVVGLGHLVSNGGKSNINSNNDDSEGSYHQQSYLEEANRLDPDTSDLLLSYDDPDPDDHLQSQFTTTTKDPYDRQSSLIIDHHHATSLLPACTSTATTTIQSFIDLNTSSPIIRYSPAATVVTAVISSNDNNTTSQDTTTTSSSPYSPYSSSAAVSVVTTTTSCVPQQTHHVKLNPQHHQTSPIHIRIPPHHYQQQQQQQQQFHSSKSCSSGSLMSPEYQSPKCFTTDAQLQSQFIHYNQQHPINMPHSSHSTTSPATKALTITRSVPLIQNQTQHPTSFAPHSFNQSNHHRESNNPIVPTGGYNTSNSQGSIQNITENIYSSSRSSHQLLNVQLGSTAQQPVIYPRQNFPSSSIIPSPSGCDYFPSSSSIPPSPSSTFPPHQLQTNLQQQHHGPPHESHHGHHNYVNPPHHHNMPPLQSNRLVGIPHQHHSPTIPLLSPTRPSMMPSPSSNVSPRWMNIISSNNNNSNNHHHHRSHSKEQGSHVIRYHHNVPMSRGGGVNISSHIRCHSSVPSTIIPQGSPPMACQYRVPYQESVNRFPIPRPSPPNQGGQNVISGVITSNSGRIQNVSTHQYSTYAHDQYRHNNNSRQFMQGQSQYYHSHPQQQTSNVPNTNHNSNNNSSSSSSTLSMVTTGPQSTGFPLVCRVSPIRSRYDDPSNYPVNNSYIHSQHQQHHVAPSPITIPNPHSAQDSNYNRQVGQALLVSGKQDFNYPYESQYSDARNFRLQITLQALPGLQPGAQGHHLLVKTETGQYQLLRVGMPTQPQAPPTTAGTIPHPVPNNNSSISTSIAQSVAPLSSTHSSSPVISTLQPNNITMATNVATTPGSVNSIMANAVTTTRLPMTNNLINTDGISSVSSSIVSSSPSAISSTTIPNPLPTASPIATATTYRLQSVSSVPPTIAAASNSMTAETAKIKCKNFLSFLLELSAKQNATVARNVKTLIQGLVDGKVNAEDFSDRLQKEVNSQPQPCLVGFLKKSLPHLRQSLATKELTIDGIRPPTLSSIASTAPVTALIPQNQVRPQAHPTPVRIITPINTTAPSTINSPIPRSTAAAVQQRFATPTPTKTNSASNRSSAANKSTVASNSSSTLSPAVTVSSGLHTTKSSGPSSTKSGSKEKDKKGGAAAAAAFSGYSGDDDINDVAAMGGVNLAEESQRILGSTEFVGTQIRSCKDESFLPAMLLQSRIKATAAKFGLDDCSSDVAAMVSHATEERLKNLLEKLSVIAEHRLDVIKVDERYEVSQDVKGQLRFLEELDKLERKRHDEQEREILIKAAKSRSKSEDPEQAKLKAKAKEMQRVAMEELRQREANLTALQAIGPRKKPKLDIPTGSQITTAQTQLGGQGASNNRQIGLRPRLKRVNLRDLLFLMEQDKETQRSHFLYKNLLLK